MHSPMTKLTSFLQNCEIENIIFCQVDHFSLFQAINLVGVQFLEAAYILLCVF